MAKKSYPAWQYYLAAGIALAFGLGLLVQQSWLYGAVFTVVGVAVAAVGFTKRTKAPVSPQ